MKNRQSLLFLVIVILIATLVSVMGWNAYVEGMTSAGPSISQSGSVAPALSTTTSGSVAPALSTTTSGSVARPVSTTTSGSVARPVSTTTSGSVAPPVSTTTSGSVAPPVKPSPCNNIKQNIDRSLDQILQHPQLRASGITKDKLDSRIRSDIDKFSTNRSPQPEIEKILTSRDPNDMYIRFHPEILQNLRGVYMEYFYWKMCTLNNK